MNGFLVMISHTLDDFPVGLFAKREGAVQLAEYIPKDHIPECWTTDASSPVCSLVVDFEDGVPVNSEIIKYYP